MKRPRLPFAVALLAAAALLGIFLCRHPARFSFEQAPHTVFFEGIDAGPLTMAPSAGCGRVNPPTFAITADGVTRTFTVALPAAYDANHPYPLALVFHGNGGNAEQMRADFPLAGTLAIYPQAVVRRVWRDEFAPHWGKEEDLPLFDALVNYAKETLCVDTARIFVVGWSAGAYFTNQLGCVRPDAVRAFVALAGGGPEHATCGKPVIGFLHHDQDDHAVLPSEGRASRDAWMVTNACSGTSHTEGGCTVFEGCAAPLVYCETSGNGHGVPASVRESVRRFLESI